MSEQEKLSVRIRAIKRIGVICLVLTLIVWLAFHAWRYVTNGLLLGEVGGAYVVYSMLRQGHLTDGLEGKALFASGMLGMVTRFVVIVAIMVVAVKVPNVSPIAALAGCLLGFVLIFVGFYGYARDRRTSPRER